MKLTENDKKAIEEYGGYFRTVMGRKVFIKEGQSLTEAMKASGKFKKDGKPIENKAEKINKRNEALAKVKERIQKKRNEVAFRQQLNQVQDGTFDKNSHLQLGETPKILIEKASLPKLPLTMPYTKAYLSINKSGNIKGNYHDLGVGTLSHLPTALHSPKYIFEHDSNPKRVEVVVELKDKKGKNIMTSIEFGTVGRTKNGKHVPANIIVTAFAPRSENYIKARIEQGKLKYEKKS